MKKMIKFTGNLKKVSMFILPIVLLCFLGCSSDDDNNHVEEQDLTYLEGNYVGTWNSTTPTKEYVDFGISAKVESSENNELTGTFFYTSNFKVCCSDAEYDGTFLIKVDGTKLTSFRLDDVQRNCEAVFTGSGVLREGDNAMVIDFTGTDCAGAHVGQIILVKQ
ncbi:hypothetical protein [Gelidibacter mesophilus]|uniref:hypothetical protein n=1 Tax=Gelidibacter mesophilus TaxID=169050 RepID=UPI00040AC21A|nr:hypothetical protein [Gelidibacter mesophilus]